jgi:hypothetical protein
LNTLLGHDEATGQVFAIRSLKALFEKNAKIYEDLKDKYKGDFQVNFKNKTHFHLHYDPELWGPEDPNVFYPSRFSPEHKRNPLAFASFGLGPRNCIGMKFAFQEIKFSLVKLLKKYEMVAGPSFPEKLEIIEGIVRTPKNGVPVIFRMRT